METGLSGRQAKVSLAEHPSALIMQALAVYKNNFKIPCNVLKSVTVFVATTAKMHKDVDTNVHKCILL